MIFDGPDHLPPPSALEVSLSGLRGYLAVVYRFPASEVMTDFFGQTLEPRTLHIGGLHHAAVYLGDHSDAGAWRRFRDALRNDSRFSGVRWGPSYIAPREHGTPGWWLNCRIDGRELEIFSCEARGPWRTLPAVEKRRRMSHLALEVEGREHLEAVLRYLAHYPEVELMSFSPEDELGHGYGHLRRADGAVLELVACSSAHPF